MTSEPKAEASLNFVRQAIDADLASGRYDQVVTRFPPEPNGHLHLGHAKSICLNFSLAKAYSGKCHLRFDDTNPLKEEQAYIDAIRRDVAWLGFEWGENEFYASDCFEQLYGFAKQLIEAGLAYVDAQSAEEIRLSRGTLKEPGKPSPFRDRPAAESLDLLERMRAGEFPDGSKVLRAKIDMASPNPNLRDPVMYRILHAEHPRTGGAWCIYPMYDFAHGQCDSIESITHSICTLEFEAHRPLYEWFVEKLGIYAPRQIEFARLNLTHTLMSKRKLLQLVDEKHVSGWDDPRMPTLGGVRRRGYPPRALREFCEAIGVAKRENVIPIERLEYHVRQVLHLEAPRRMAVLNPLKVVIENYPDGQSETVEAINNPEDPSAGRRPVPFSKVLYIERDDFMEDPPRKFFRLAPGREVRLRCAYFITCNEVVKDAEGNILELRCSYDPQTRGGDSPDGRKVKGTLHWVSAEHALDAEVRLYDRLFTVEDPAAESAEAAIETLLNPESLSVVRGAKLEPSLGDLGHGETCQFERIGYFCVDPDSSGGKPVFNRTVTLRDAWAKQMKNRG